MSEQPSTTPTAEPAFPSLAALRAAHSQLLEAYRNQNGTAPTLFWQEVASFLQRGRRAGALLDREEERATAQSLLDYWTATAYSTGQEMPDAALIDFDPTLAPELPDDQCPYVGLAAFHEGREKYFFGRDRLVNALLAKVAETRLVAVVGPSGSGKSSLVLAGLIPQLKDGAIQRDANTPSSETWHYTPRLVPGSDPLVNLASVIQPLLAAQGDGAAVAEGMRRAADYLVNLFNETMEQPVVLVVDQFEESFTLCTNDEVRAAFFNNLLALVQAPGLRHTVILTMRTDFESFVARVPPLLPLFEAGLLRVTPLNAAELRAVIEKPAEMVGLKFEAGVVDALLQDVLGEPAALPLLQFTLLKLWENRDRNRITWETYKRLGGGRLALARSADRLYESLIPEDQVTARRILLRLVRPGEGLEVTSNRVRQGVLYLRGEAHDRVDRVLQKLVDADLVRLTTGERPEDTQVEVAHEALVRNWPRLVGWLEDERVRIRERLRVTEAAEQWLKLGRDPGALLRGALLEDALRYTDLNELEQAYVQASQEAIAAVEREKEEARQREVEQALALAKSERQWAEFQEKSANDLRRRNTLLTAISVIAVLLAIAAFAFFQRSNLKATEANFARSTAEAEATAAAAARLDAVTKATMAAEEAANARLAEAVAVAEAATANAAVAELNQKQAELGAYIGALNSVQQVIANVTATLIYANATPTPALPSNTPLPPTALVPASATPQPTPQPAVRTSPPPVTANRVITAPAAGVETIPATAALTASAPVTAAASLLADPAITATAIVSDRADAAAGLTPATALTNTVPLLTTDIVSETQIPRGALIANVPDVETNLYARATEDSPILQVLRYPAQLTVLRADNLQWVKVETTEGVVGWVQAWLLTYQGDAAWLPLGLRHLVIELPFTQGVIQSLEGTTAYALLANPQNPDSELGRAPVGVNVTLLFYAEGPVMYGSNLWFYVRMADPAAPERVLTGYLPAQVIVPR
ncbi:MAG: SH3 domain-containing protein [Caldilineaceae bacterium]